MKCLLVLLALSSASWAQKSIDAPHPALIEVPMQEVALPLPSPAVVTEAAPTSVSVAAPTIEVPKRHESVVDIPYSPIQMPSGGVQEVTADYDIPQPVIQVPGPVIKETPVVFNVPQTIIQVPVPVIRHRPILYTVPHVLKLHRPNIRHQQVFYDVPSALVTKSGYHSSGPALHEAFQSAPASFDLTASAFESAPILSNDFSTGKSL